MSLYTRAAVCVACTFHLSATTVSAFDPSYLSTSPPVLEDANVGAHHSHRRLASNSVSSDPMDLAPPSRKFLPLTLSTDEDENLHYMISVTAGTPAQSLKIILDTGSSELMLLNNSYCAKVNTHGPCFNPKTSGSFINTQKKVSFELLLDEETVKDPLATVCREFVRADVQYLGCTATQNFTKQMDFFLSETFMHPDNRLHTFPNADGIIGLGYGFLSVNLKAALNKLLEAEVTDQRGLVFGLDLNKPGLSSKLDIGGLDEVYRSGMSWAPTVSGATGQAYHSFKFRTLKICGVDMNPTYTDKANQYTAIVDTGAHCLSLPHDLFDQVMSWLPVVCHPSHDYVINKNLMGTTCELPAGVDTHLPTLEFSVASDKTLYLPMSDLIMTRSNGKRIMCVIQQPKPKTDSLTGFVSFGNRCLRSLYTVVHIPEHRVGMANKDPNQKNSNVQCKQRTACKGMQIFHENYNLCRDPDCSSFYFFQLNHQEKTCELTSAFHIMFSCLAVLFLAVEIGLQEWYASMSKRISSNGR